MGKFDSETLGGISLEIIHLSLLESYSEWLMGGESQV